MAENKTKPTGVSITAFIDTLGDDIRRRDAKALVKLMRATSGEKAAMWGPSIIGFGSQHYAYASGREGDMPIIGFSPRKAATVIYGAIGFAGAAPLLERLGPHSTGKGCLYIKRLADVDAVILERLLRQAVAAKRKK